MRPDPRQDDAPLPPSLEPTPARKKTRRLRPVPIVAPCTAAAPSPSRPKNSPLLRRPSSSWKISGSRNASLRLTHERQAMAVTPLPRRGNRRGAALTSGGR